ncbi:hypothetical protein BD560DRAFT_53410 [Blakeslea trispora]|nr:hypothetical protein BD560DRAFT_53410 [Blakeslea trispora]
MEDNGQPYQHHVVTKISQNRKSTQRNTFFMMGGAGGSSSYYDFDDPQIEASTAKAADSYIQSNEKRENNNYISPIKTHFEAESHHPVDQSSIHSPIQSPIQSPVHSPIYSSKHSTLYSSIHSPIYSDTHESLYSYANSNTQSAFCLRTNSSLYSPDAFQSVNTDVLHINNTSNQSNMHTSQQADSTTYTRPNLSFNSSNRMIIPITESDISPAETTQVAKETSVPSATAISSDTGYENEKSLSNEQSQIPPSYEAEKYVELSISESVTNDSKMHIQQDFEEKPMSSKRSCCIIS